MLLRSLSGSCCRPVLARSQLRSYELTTGKTVFGLAACGAQSRPPRVVKHTLYSVLASAVALYQHVGRCRGDAVAVCSCFGHRFNSPAACSEGRRLDSKTFQIASELMPC